jgi:hypothetical protein
MRTRARGGLVLAAAFVFLANAPGCRQCDDAQEEAEDRDMARDHFWRAQIRIVGAGSVATHVRAFDCASDGSRGDCGPKLVRYKELAPPVMIATAAPGYRFDHWESSTLEPDGAVVPRNGRPPDGPLYVNGFGYSDTGELETVTAVFVPDGD